MKDNLLFLDAETFYDSRNKYDLRNLSIPEYVRDEKFKLHGIGIAVINDQPLWLGGEHISYVNDYSKFVFVGHNIKFDGFILAEKYGVKPPEWRDTKAMARAVLGRKVEDYSLRTLAKYFGLPEKGQMKTDGKRDLSEAEEAELASYCLHDVWLCREIYKRLAEDFPENQYPLLSQTIEMFVNPKLVLDVKLLEETAKKEKEDKIKVFSEIGIDKKVFSSNVKFPELLRSKGYAVPTKRSPSTGKAIPALALGDPEFLDLLESQDETLRRLCEARKEAKSTLMETRSEKLARIGKTGPWPFDVEFSGAVQTHRYSGGGQAGGNPQNFTRDSALRASVHASGDSWLVCGDFSNIEFRLVAYLSNDPGFIQAIERGDDIYCGFASAFYGRRITKADEVERRFGKTAILGLGYGMGPTKFQRTVRLQTGLSITIEEARKAVRLYRGLYSKVPALWRYFDSRLPALAAGDKDVSIAQLRFENQTIVLPSGLRLQYPNLRKDGDEWVYDSWGKKGEKVPVKLYGGKLLENICQALAGELCKEVMARFPGKVVGQIHDEVILVSDDPVTDRAELQAAMEVAPSWLPKMKLEAEVGYGRTWAEAKKNA